MAARLVQPFFYRAKQNNFLRLSFFCRIVAADLLLKKAGTGGP